MIDLPEDQFMSLVRRMRKLCREFPGRGDQALFAIPGRGIRKVSTSCKRFADYLDDYAECLVGVYNADVSAAHIEDDLRFAGVRIVESAA